MRIYCEAKIKHNKETIQTLFKVASHVYEKKRILLRLLLGAVMVIAGLVVRVSIIAQAFLFMIGAWLLVSKDFKATEQAEETIRVRGGSLPDISYIFTENAIEVRDKNAKNNKIGRRIKYQQLKRIVEDAGYLYLFEDRDSVCMVDKKSIKEMKIEDLITHIEKRSGLSWEQDKSFFSMNLKEFLQMIKNAKKT